MRKLLPLVAPVLLVATAQADPHHVTRLTVSDFGYAEWLADGSGFYVVGAEHLTRFDADGHPRGVQPIKGVPRDGGVQLATIIAHRGLSRDGRRLALVVQDGSSSGAPLVVDLERGESRRLAVANDGMVTSLEWTADGHLIGGSLSGGRFIADADGAIAPLCPVAGGFAIHVHPDGRRLGFGVDKLYITDGDCAPRWTLSPWIDASTERTWVKDFAFSPSGNRVAAMAGVGFTQGRMWILSLDGKERVDTGITPESPPVVWLDEETLIVAAPNGPTGTSQRTLHRVTWRTHAVAPLLPPKPTCSDTEPSVSPRGGRVVFQRLCDDPKDSFMGLIRTATK
jgi:hypothetical protein